MFTYLLAYLLTCLLTYLLACLLACLLAYLLTYLPTYLPTYLQYDRLITRCCPCSCACLTETEGAAPSSGVVDQSQTAVRGRRPAADADDQQGPGPGKVHDSLPWRHFRHASGLGGPRQGLLRQLRSPSPSLATFWKLG